MGYDLSFVWWCTFPLDGMLCRMAVMLYSRRSIRNAVEKEFDFMRPAHDILKRCAARDEVRDCEKMVWDDLSKNTVAVGTGP